MQQFNSLEAKKALVLVRRRHTSSSNLMFNGMTEVAWHVSSRRQSTYMKEMDGHNCNIRLRSARNPTSSEMPGDFATTVLQYGE